MSHNGSHKTMYKPYLTEFTMLPNLPEALHVSYYYAFSRSYDWDDGNLEAGRLGSAYRSHAI